MQALFLDDLLRWDVQDADFRGEDHVAVRCHVIAGGAQAVSVQHCPKPVAVRKHDGRGAVPRLHHRGVILVKIARFLREVCIVRPWLGDEHRHGKRHVHAAHDEKFQGVVQHGGIRSLGVDDGQHLVQVAAQIVRVHRLLPREHFVRVAADGVDLAVVHEEPVGVRPLPARVGVGAKARVHRGDGRLVVGALQVQKELPQLSDQKHPLVDDRAAGKRHHVGIFVALLKLPPGHVEPAVKRKPRVHVGGLLDERLHDARHLVARLLPQDRGVCRHLAPPEQQKPLFFENDLKHLHGLAALALLLREEKLPDAICARVPQRNAEGSASFGKELVRDLQQDPHAIPCFSLGVLSGPMR